MNDCKKEANETNDDATRAQKASEAPDSQSGARQARAVHPEGEARGPETRAIVVDLSGGCPSARAARIDDAYRAIRDAGGYVASREYVHDSLYLTYAIPGAPAPELPGMEPFTAEQLADIRAIKLDQFVPGFTAGAARNASPGELAGLAALLHAEAKQVALAAVVALIEETALGLNALFHLLRRRGAHAAD